MDKPGIEPRTSSVLPLHYSPVDPCRYRLLDSIPVGTDIYPPTDTASSDALDAMFFRAKTPSGCFSSLECCMGGEVLFAFSSHNCCELAATVARLLVSLGLAFLASPICFRRACRPVEINDRSIGTSNEG